ncbi:hypothetical protein LJC55_04080 [Eubacteriales bacterium OttesenSCG-928-N14]|nr:hypothetical protein [Eubacteriales bacterium OttesenSCG-928-N14]
MRSPNANNSNNALVVNNDGSVNGNNVNNENGVRPALLQPPETRMQVCTVCAWSKGALFPSRAGVAWRG